MVNYDAQFSSKVAMEVSYRTSSVPKDELERIWRGGPIKIDEKVSGLFKPRTRLLIKIPANSADVLTPNDRRPIKKRLLRTPDKQRRSILQRSVFLPYRIRGSNRGHADC